MNSSSVAQPMFASMNRLFNPALLVAVGFHVLLLAIPVSGGSNSAEPKAEESPVEEESEMAKLSSPDVTTPSSQRNTPALKSPTVASQSPGSPSTQRTAIASLKARTIARSTRPPAARRQSTPRTASASPAARRSAKTASSRAHSAKSNSAETTPATPTRDRTQETTPTFSDSVTQQTTPSSSAQPTQPQTVAIAPSPVKIDPFTQFPQYPFGRSLIGSLRLRPPGTDRETYAFNTREKMTEAIEFYKSEIPQDLFEPLALKTEDTDLTVYEVKPKNGDRSQYLHLIPFKGRIVILLLSEELSELERLKEQAEQQLKEQSDFLHTLSPIEQIRQQFQRSQLTESQTTENSSN